jgi:hypothetical protein
MIDMAYKSDRREGEKRREREHIEFPFKDKDGKLVKCDRRNNPDRRIKILVTSEVISEKEFNEYYKK